MKKLVKLEKEDMPDMTYIFNHIKEAVILVAHEDKFASNRKFGALTTAALINFVVAVAKSFNVTRESILKQFNCCWEESGKEKIFN